MLLLTSTSDLIRVTTTAAINTDVHASWVDNAAGTITPGRTNTPTISTATTTTVVAAPAVSTQRNVKILTIRNRHASTSQTVTVIHTDGSNALELIQVTLAAGETLTFCDNVGFIVYLASGTIKSGFDPNAVAITGGTLSGVTETLAAGTTAIAPLTYTSGTNLTTATAGAKEYDGKVFYSSHVANARGVDLTEQFMALTGAYTLASQTTVQKLFNVPANGAITVAAATTYFFECLLSLSSMSATSGNMKFDVLGAGTATLTSTLWTAIGLDATTPGTAAALSGNITATNVASGDIVVAATGTAMFVLIKGIIRINGAGTIIPSCLLTTAATPAVGVNSYFRLTPAGTNTVTSVGNIA